MDWVKLWTTIHDDPGMLRLSDRAFRYYINAWSWSGRHDTDGVFEVFGKPPKVVAELVEHGKFEPTTDPSVFLIHGWGGRQVTANQAAARSAAASTASNARWHPERNASRIAPNAADGNADKTREEKSRGEKKGLATHPRRERDPIFESVAEVCGMDWRNDLTTTARGQLNRAAAELRALRPRPDDEEIHRRAANWPTWFDNATITPSALVKFWPQLDNARISNGRRRPDRAAETAAHAAELAAQARGELP